MIRHTLLFSFRPDASAEQVASVLGALVELPRRYPDMERFGIGANVSERDDTFSHVMTLEFERREQLEGYLNSQYHEWFVRTRFRPNVSRRAIGSYEVG